MFVIIKKNSVHGMRANAHEISFLYKLVINRNLNRSLTICIMKVGFSTETFLHTNDLCLFYQRLYTHLFTRCQFGLFSNVTCHYTTETFHLKILFHKDSCQNSRIRIFFLYARRMLTTKLFHNFIVWLRIH